jgi:deoxyribodipyrimidine photo-lyase
VFKGKFLTETVSSLQRSLRGIGSDLLVFHGKPEIVLPELVAAGHGDMVVVQRESTSEEMSVQHSVEELLAAKDATLQSFFGHTLHHIDDLPFPADEVPELFTTMRNLIEKSGAEVPVRPLIPTPTALASVADLRAEMQTSAAVSLHDATPNLPQLGYTREECDAASAAAAITPIRPSGSVMSFEGGEGAGLARVEEYCATGLATYKKTRNGLVGRNYSTKFSPWLAVGALSPRYIYWRIEEFDRQQEGGQTVHTYWVVFELMCRCVFELMCWAGEGKRCDARANGSYTLAHHTSRSLGHINIHHHDLRS